MEIYNNILIEPNKIKQYKQYESAIRTAITDKKRARYYFNIKNIKNINMSVYSDIDKEILKLNEDVFNKNKELKTLRDVLLYEETIDSEEQRNYEILKTEYLKLIDKLKNKQIERDNSYKNINIENKTIYDNINQLKDELREKFLKINTLQDETLRSTYIKEYLGTKEKINTNYKKLKKNIDKLKYPIFILKNINEVEIQKYGISGSVKTKKKKKKKTKKTKDLSNRKIKSRINFMKSIKKTN